METPVTPTAPLTNSYSDILAAALRLNRGDRERLVQSLTESVAESPSEVAAADELLAAANAKLDKIMEERYRDETPEELHAELERRLAYLEAHPESGISFDEIKAMLNARYGV